MSKKVLYDKGDQLALPVPSGVLSGAPVAVGQLPGVALTDRDADGEATVKFDGVHLLMVRGITNGAAASAVAVGDKIYFTVGATPQLNKDTTGVPFGIALAAVPASTNVEIPVKIVPGI